MMDIFSKAVYKLAN